MFLKYMEYPKIQIQKIILLYLKLIIAKNVVKYMHIKEINGASNVK
jgi:hypothetical protein